MLYNTHIDFKKGVSVMEKAKIDRINYLAKKSKEQGLNELELAEQKALREEYLAAIRENFKKTLDNIEITDKPIS